MAEIKTSSWFTKLPADHCRIGISRGTPSAQKAPYRNYRQLTPGPWFKTCATPQEYVRLYYSEVLASDRRYWLGTERCKPLGWQRNSVPRLAHLRRASCKPTPEEISA